MGFTFVTRLSIVVILLSLTLELVLLYYVPLFPLQLLEYLIKIFMFLITNRTIALMTEVRKLIAVTMLK